MSGVDEDGSDKESVISFHDSDEEGAVAMEPPPSSSEMVRVGLASPATTGMSPWGIIMGYLGSVYPVNYAIIIVIMVVWLFIFYDHYKWTISDPFKPGSGGGAPPMTTPADVDKFREEQTFNSTGNNSVVYDVDQSQVVADENRSTLCFAFGIGCDDPTTGGDDRNATDYKHQEDKVTPIDEDLTKKVTLPVDIATAVADNTCANLTRVEALSVLCQRKITLASELRTVIKGEYGCQGVMDPSNCNVFQRCLLNIAQKHFTKEAGRILWWSTAEPMLGENKAMKFVENPCTELEKLTK